MTQFAAGDTVKVEDLGLPGHVRVPLYIRGRSGTIERFCGSFRNPEALAYGDLEAPELELYRVRFRQRDVWPDYEGPGADTLDLEIYRHWLRPVGVEKS